MKRELTPRATALLIAALLMAAPAGAQVQPAGLRNAADEKPAGSPRAVAVPADADPLFKTIYRDFYNSYRLGPADQIAVRVVGQPDYTLERAEVSPVGRIYHPLIGEVEVVGLTVPELRTRLTAAFSEYIIDPKVSVSLLEAKSAMIGLLGDIAKPGIMTMTRPMTIFEAITAAGGVTRYGKSSKVTLLRVMPDGTRRNIHVNVKRIMEGKARPEEDVQLQAGDTVIVHGNFRKTLADISSITGFVWFASFIADRW